jgi:hypothetical protein
VIAERVEQGSGDHGATHMPGIYCLARDAPDDFHSGHFGPMQTSAQPEERAVSGAVDDDEGLIDDRAVGQLPTGHSTKPSLSNVFISLPSS